MAAAWWECRVKGCGLAGGQQGGRHSTEGMKSSCWQLSQKQQLAAKAQRPEPPATASPATPTGCTAPPSPGTAPEGCSPPHTAALLAAPCTGAPAAAASAPLGTASGAAQPRARRASIHHPRRRCRRRRRCRCRWRLRRWWWQQRRRWQCCLPLLVRRRRHQCAGARAAARVQPRHFPLPPPQESRAGCWLLRCRAPWPVLQRHHPGLLHEQPAPHAATVALLPPPERSRGHHLHAATMAGYPGGGGGVEIGAHQILRTQNTGGRRYDQIGMERAWCEGFPKRAHAPHTAPAAPRTLPACTHPGGSVAPAPAHPAACHLAALATDRLFGCAPACPRQHGTCRVRSKVKGVFLIGQRGPRLRVCHQMPKGC